MGNLNVYRITILGVLVVIVLGSIAVVLTLPSEPSQEQYRTGLLSAIAVPTIAALLTLLRADTVNNKVDVVKTEMDGHLDAHDRMIDQAIRAIKEVKVQAGQTGDSTTQLPPDPNIPPQGV